MRRNRLVKFGVAICLVIALITAVGVLTYVQTMSELETNTQDDYTAMSQQEATELTAWQRERASALTVITADSFFEDPEATDEIRRYLSSVDLLSADDEAYLVAYSPIHGTDLTDVLAVPESEAYALSTQISRSVILIIAIAVGGLGAIGVGIARPTVRELDRLGERANELEAGNLDVDLETDSVDEIGRLYGAFDAMRESLRQRIEESETQRADAETQRADTFDGAADQTHDLATQADRLTELTNNFTVGSHTEAETGDATD